jgi:crotonobetainyl-CoA:carnitine CoA-transferase CaiB-like acyl-CoA transferase
MQIDLSDDARFATEYERFRHRRALAEILQREFSTAGRDDWIEKLRAAGVPCGPVNSIDQVLADPQFETRGMFPRDEARYGQETIVNTPIIADGAPRARGKAPRIGESTSGLLAELGYDDQQIEALLRDRVVAAAQPETVSDTVEMQK